MGIKNKKEKKKPQGPPESQDQTEVTVEEQGSLIDTTPTNFKEIVETAKRYKKAVVKRMAAEQIEVEEKQRLLALIKESNAQRLEDGKIRLQADGFLITVTPRDELIRVKDENNEEEE
jgi:hypothetical protein